MIFRKAILLVHGFAGSITDYQNLGNDLQLYKDFDVYTFTLPGHDKIIINKVTKDDWIKYAEEQVERLISRGYRKIYIIGHSMGGVIASHLAIKYSKYVKKLILVAPAFRYFSFKNDKLDIIRSLEKVPKLFKDYDPDMVLSRLFKVPTQTIKEFISLVDTHYDDPKKITCPTLIIQGTSDNIVPIDSSQYVHDMLQSKINILIEMDKVTHDVFKSERYPEVLKLITKFLKNNYISKKEIKKI